MGLVVLFVSEFPNSFGVLLRCHERSFPHGFIVDQAQPPPPEAPLTGAQDDDSETTRNLAAVGGNGWFDEGRNGMPEGGSRATRVAVTLAKQRLMTYSYHR